MSNAFVNSLKIRSIPFHAFGKTLVGLLACALSITAEAGISIRSSTIDLGGTGKIVNGQIINALSLAQVAESWLRTGAGYANMFAPVGQFTGFLDDGTPLPYLDLIPLTTSSIQVTNPAGGTVLFSGEGGTILNEKVILGGEVLITQPQGDISMGVYQ